jgi:sodium transport system permease protein
MDLSRVGIVFRKEMLEAIRDRRTIISTIVIPIIIFPVIFVSFGGFAKVIMATAQSERSKVAIIGAEHSPELAARVRSSAGFEIVDGANFQERVTEKKLRAVLEIPPNFNQPAGTNSPPRATIYFHAGEFRSQNALRNLQKILRDYRDDVVAKSLGEHGVSSAILNPFEVKEQNTAPPKKVAANLLGGLIPYLIIFLTFAGCIAPALDLTVGEKERGTMETILASPIGRTELVLGKFLVVVTISSATTIMALLSNAMTLFIPTLIMRDLTKGTSMPLDVSLVGVIGIFIMVAPLAVTFAAGQIAIATCAGNFREAQSYMSPLMIVVLLPAVAALLPGFDITMKLAWVPILNVCLISREILSGTFHWELIGIVFLSSCIYAAAALTAAVSVFKSETVLART